MIVCNSAIRDGIHAREGLLITSGILNIISTEDGIDGDEGMISISGGSITTTNNSYDINGISSDTSIVISGGIINITVTGDQSKGINSNVPITLSGGTITIHNSGDAALVPTGSGYDPSYCTAIRSIDDIEISGADITIVASGKAGRGISSDADINMTAGNVQVTSTGNGATYTNPKGVLDAYVADCFNTGGDIVITGGSVITSSSGSGGKGFNSNSELIIGTSDSSPIIHITTTGTKVHISGSGQNSQDAEAKAVKVDTAVVINNGDMLITGGTIIVHGPQNAPEVGMDYNGTCNMNGGLLVISGTNSNMTEAPSNSSDQYCIKVMMNQIQSSSTIFHIQDASANSLLTFQPVRNYYSIIFSSSALQQGQTYSIYTGGTCTGHNIDGLYSGGVYSGGTFRKSFNVNNIITNVNF